MKSTSQMPVWLKQAQKMLTTASRYGDTLLTPYSELLEKPFLSMCRKPSPVTNRVSPSRCWSS